MFHRFICYSGLFLFGALYSCFCQIQTAQVQTSAVIGKIFRFRLPFNNPQTQIRVELLPSWLHFERQSNLLIGVPLVGDASTAAAGGTGAREARFSYANQQYAFTIHLIDQFTGDEVGQSSPPNQSPISNAASTVPVSCPVGHSITVASTRLDLDPASLTPLQRVALLDRFATSLGLTESSLSLHSGPTEIFSDRPLVQGAGDSKQPHYAAGASVYWVIGCGDVYSQYFPLLQSLQLKAKDGSLHHDVGFPVLSWKVISDIPISVRIKQKHTKWHRLRHHTGGQKRRRLVEESDALQDVGSGDEPKTDDDEITTAKPTLASTTLPTTTTTTFKPEPTAKPEEPTVKPEPEPTAKPEPEPTVKPEPKPTTKPDPKPTTKLEAEPTTKPELEPTVKPEPSPTITPEAEPTTKLATPPKDSPAPRSEPEKVPTSPRASVAELEATSEPVAETSKPSEVMPKTTETKSEPEPTPEQPEPEVYLLTAEPETMPESTAEPTTSTTSTTTTTTTTVKPNKPPMVEMALSEAVIFNLGSMKEFMIPERTFYDAEDGNTNKLAVRLDCGQRSTPEWLRLRLDAFSGEKSISALPVPSQGAVVGEKTECYLVATDSMGAMVKTPIQFEVKGPRLAQGVRLSHSWTVTIDMMYKKLIETPSLVKDLIQKIADYFKVEPSAVVVNDLRSGSVVIDFSMSSWTHAKEDSKCPLKTIKESIDSLVDVDESTNSSHVKGLFIDSLGSFKVLSLKLAPKSKECQKHPDFPQMVMTVFTPPKAKEATQNETDDFWITTIIPIVIIVVFMLIAGIIAFALYKRKQRGKMNVPHSEEDGYLRKKGGPVILPDEAIDDDEDTPPPSKPYILEDEKASMPPPSYHPHNIDSATESNHSSTPPSDRKDALEMNNVSPNSASSVPFDSPEITQETPLLDQHSQGGPAVQPPPPFTGVPVRNGKHVSGVHSRLLDDDDRKPPPYVPP